MRWQGERDVEPHGGAWMMTSSLDAGAGRLADAPRKPGTPGSLAPISKRVFPGTFTCDHIRKLPPNLSLSQS